MNPQVLRRFIIIAGIALLVVFTAVTVFKPAFERAPGDYYTEMGGNRLRDREFKKAMEYFNKALQEQPDHRGALMGRALVHIQTENYRKAVSELTYLIAYMKRNLKPDDRTGRAVLAAAYANRGIVHDRKGRYKMALNDYVSSLKVDEGAVDGPDLFHKILYGNSRPSTVRKRARYIHQQLQLPPEKRVMRRPEIDKKQRMYKP